MCAAFPFVQLLSISIGTDVRVCVCLRSAPQVPHNFVDYIPIRTVIKKGTTLAKVGEVIPFRYFYCLTALTLTLTLTPIQVLLLA